MRCAGTRSRLRLSIKMSSFSRTIPPVRSRRPVPEAPAAFSIRSSAPVRTTFCKPDHDPVKTCRPSPGSDRQQSIFRAAEHALHQVRSSLCSAVFATNGTGSAKACRTLGRKTQTSICALCSRSPHRIATDQRAGTLNPASATGRAASAFPGRQQAGHPRQSLPNQAVLAPSALSRRRSSSIPSSGDPRPISSCRNNTPR